jgi:hypothetical protein
LEIEEAAQRASLGYSEKTLIMPLVSIESELKMEKYLEKVTVLSIQLVLM